jgi:O-phosphoseryl-tRNA(Cys) synthetase
MILISTSKGAKICKEMYGDLEYGLDIRNMNVEVVVEKVKSLLDDEDEIRERLLPISEEMKKRALNAGGILAKVL